MLRIPKFVSLCGLLCCSLLPACQTSVAGRPTTSTRVSPSPAPIYQTIQSHDGHADPDDNLALLAGFFAIKRNVEKSAGRVEQIGLVYGDTTAARKNLMLTGTDAGYGNYRFFLSYSRAAVESVGCPAAFDEVVQTYDFNANSRSQLTTGGQFVYDHIKAALDSPDPSKFYRVVYSAGGGHNAAFEAIQLLRKQGRSDARIKDHFAIIQHSNWNLNNCMDPAVRDATLPFTIRIADQNPYSGGPKNRDPPPPMPVSPSRTSPLFAHVWNIATGYNGTTPDSDKPLQHFLTTLDASDAGSHSFASTPAALDAYWNTRDNVSTPIPYNSYTPDTMKADMVDSH